MAETLQSHHGHIRPDETLFAIQDGRAIDKAQGGKGWSVDGVSFTLDCTGSQAVAHMHIAEPFSFDERSVTSKANRTRVGPDQPCGTLHTSPHAVAFQCQGTNVSTDGDVAGTFRGGNGHVTGGGPCVAFQEQGREGGRAAEWHELNVANRWVVRRLTPFEAEALQGFPGHFTLIPMPKGKGKERKPRDHDETIAYLMGHGFSREDAADLARTPDGPRYRALGNSMAVNVMRWIGWRIETVRALISGRAA